MADLRTDFGIRFGMHEIGNPFPRCLVRWRVKTGAARRDAAGIGNTGHFGINQPRATLGPLGIMHQMPVGRAAIHRLVLRHRRHHDAVFQFHVTQCKRHEHRVTDFVIRRYPRLPLEPSLGIFQPLGITHPKVLMADALRPGQKRIGELHRIEMEIPFDLLEPFHRIACR